jgi:hypothetical protein
VRYVKADIEDCRVTFVRMALSRGEGRGSFRWRTAAASAVATTARDWKSIISNQRVSNLASGGSSIGAHGCLALWFWNMPTVLNDRILETTLGIFMPSMLDWLESGGLSIVSSKLSRLPLIRDFPQP